MTCQTAFFRYTDLKIVGDGDLAVYFLVLKQYEKFYTER